MTKVDEILIKALTATKAGRLKWELVGRGGFRTQVGQTFLTISEDNSGFAFSIYDDDANLLESSRNSLLESTPGLYIHPEQELHELARRAALKVDDRLESLDQLLQDLI